MGVELSRVEVADRALEAIEGGEELGLAPGCLGVQS
jgi:hypothetical protein